MDNNDTVTLPSNYDLDVDGAVALYVELRAQKAGLKAELEKTLKPITETMQQIETLLLKHLQDTRTKSASTEHGTVYQRVSRSATIRDRKAFQEFVVEQQAFDLIDWRPNKVQVFEYIEKQGGDVPGVNTSSYMTIGVRKSDSSTQEDE